jgi:hypothetical protein
MENCGAGGWSSACDKGPSAQDIGTFHAYSFAASHIDALTY